MKKILLSIFTLTVSLTYAQNVFQETFESYNTGVQLSGQGTWSNNTSNGGLGSCAGAVCSNAKVLAQSISYIGYGSSNNSFEVTNNVDSVGRLFTPVTSGELYVGLVINLSNGSTSSNDFLRVMSGASYNTTFRLTAKNAGGGSFYIGMSKASGVTVYSNTVYNFNSSHLIILKYSISSAGVSDDVLNVYVDPTYNNGEPTTPTLFSSSGTDNATSIDRISFSQQASSNNPTGYAGLVSVAKTWADLTFNLSNSEFTKNTFIIVSNQVKNGLLSVKSNKYLENATLNIYDIQGKIVESKTISLQESVNDIAINPIKNSGVYLVEILSENNQHFTQKIILN